MRLVDRYKLNVSICEDKFSREDKVMFLNFIPFYYSPGFNYGKAYCLSEINKARIKNGIDIEIKSCEDIDISNQMKEYIVISNRIFLKTEHNFAVKLYIVVCSDDVTSTMKVDDDTWNYFFKDNTSFYFASEDQIVLSDNYLDYKLKKFINPKKEDKTYEPFILPSFMKCGHFIENFIRNKRFSLFLICFILVQFYFLFMR